MYSLNKRGMVYCNMEVKPGLHISRKDRKHMVANTFFKLFTYALVFT